ncbi:MAG: NUDIX domain-containing protein [Candidatus Peregrinibacteria bacterium]
MQRHFTATGFVVDSQNRTLLLWHKRLKRWMPPGGHVDENESPEETAQRECKEETGLDVEIIGDGSTSLTTGEQPDVFAESPEEGKLLKKPIALLLENIPALPERDELAHQHMDFVYLARPLDEAQVLCLAQEEGAELHWFTHDEIAALNEATEIFANVKAYILRTIFPSS